MKAYSHPNRLAFRRWGLNTNLTRLRDLRTLRTWYVAIYTPWRIIDVCGKF